jgi:hypothetical protein
MVSSFLICAVDVQSSSQAPTRDENPKVASKCDLT